MGGAEWTHKSMIHQNTCYLLGWRHQLGQIETPCAAGNLSTQMAPSWHHHPPKQSLIL